MKVMIVDKDGVRHSNRVKASYGYTWVPFTSNGSYCWREVRIRTLPIIPNGVCIVVK